MHVDTFDIQMHSVEKEAFIGSPFEPAESERGLDAVRQLSVKIYHAYGPVQAGMLRAPQIRLIYW